QIAGARNQRAPIALRVNPDIAAPTHKYIATGQSETKFGVPLHEAAAVYVRAAKMPNIIIRGMQMHIGSQITEAAPFVAAIETIAPLVAELKLRHALEFFSIGGGLGIAYESSIASGRADWWAANRSHPLTIRDYANAIVPPLEKTGLSILLEPGRLLVGNGGLLLTRVRYIKESGQKKFAIV